MADFIGGNQLSQAVDMRSRIESYCIMWMHTRGAPDESPILSSNQRGSASGAEDILGAAS